MTPPTILLVEDDDSLREILAINLSGHGYRVDQAADGQQGLRAYDPEVHDAIITDIRMPGLSGLELLRQVRALDPGALVLVLTAFGGSRGALEAIQLGAFHYVEKPVNTRALIEELERGLAHKKAQSRPPGRAGQGPMVAVSPSMNRVLHVVDRVADSDAPVMILGESGVGKELVARAIHDRSARAKGPFVALNCAAIPEALLESMLFGYEKGAFTGAVKRTEGKFAAAAGGTLFLDEIAEMSPQLQSKLLRVVQDGMVERLGSLEPQAVDVRLVCATHQDLEEAMAQGRFRRDLYYRLCVIPLTLPPLRDRRQDIPVLTRHFLRLIAPHEGLEFDPRVDTLLMQYPWPGNVRELKNVVERMILLREGDLLGPGDVPPEVRRGAVGGGGGDLAKEGGLPFELPAEGLDLMALERRVIVAALGHHGGNQSATARYLNIPRHILTYRIEKFGIEPAEYDGV